MENINNLKDELEKMEGLMNEYEHKIEVLRTMMREAAYEIRIKELEDEVKALRALVPLVAPRITWPDFIPCTQPHSNQPYQPTYPSNPYYDPWKPWCVTTTTSPTLTGTNGLSGVVKQEVVTGHDEASVSPAQESDMFQADPMYVNELTEKLRRALLKRGMNHE